VEISLSLCPFFAFLLGGICFVVAELLVDALDVAEDALPVRILHLHHVVDLKERGDASEPPAKSMFKMI